MKFELTIEPPGGTTDVNIGVTLVPSHGNHSIDGLDNEDSRVTSIKCGETEGRELLYHLRKILQ
jgi:hypothetical protein